MQAIDSKAHGKMLKGMLEDLAASGNQNEIKLNKLIDFSLGPNNKVFL